MQIRHKQVADISGQCCLLEAHEQEGPKIV